MQDIAPNYSESDTVFLDVANSGGWLAPGVVLSQLKILSSQQRQIS